MNDLNTAKLSGRIDKYDLDIDFTKLDYLEVEVHSAEYAGGIDVNGHERKDNFKDEVNGIIIYAAPDNSTILIYDKARNLYDTPIDLSDALEQISEYLDLSAGSADVSVFVQPKDGEKQYIDSAALKAKSELDKLRAETNIYFSVVNIDDSSVEFFAGKYIDEISIENEEAFQQYVEENPNGEKDIVADYYCWGDKTGEEAQPAAPEQLRIISENWNTESRNATLIGSKEFRIEPEECDEMEVE